MPGAIGVGYVLDVQAELLSHLATRVVVPLVPEGKGPKPIGDLNPVFDIAGGRHVMLTQAIASVACRELQRTVGTLDAHHDRITRALDILLLGL